MISRSNNTPGPAAGSRLFRPLAAGLAVTSAGSLSAAVIHNNTPINGSQNFAVDAGDDFTFSVYPGMIGMWDPATKMFMPGSPSSVSLDPINGAQISTSALSFGAQVDGSASFTEAGVAVTGTQYYGFSLPGSTTLYGWLNVTHVSGDGWGSGTVNEWAYDTTGAAIAVGQTTAAVPEPASAAALAALVAGSAAMLRRRQRVLAA
jgi:hypothetical protein